MALNNTQQRIISAIVLILIVVLFVYNGSFPTKIFIIITGLLTCDEIIVNFLKKSRTGKTYQLNITAFLLLSFSLLFFEDIKIKFFQFFVIAVLLHGFLLSYLFLTKIENHFIKKLLSSGKLPIVLFLFPSFSMLIFITDKIYWVKYLVLLLVLTFATDTGAWFFGKLFGKHKLWQTISPKKTIEGLIGGVFTSAFLSTLVYYLFFNEFRFDYFTSFALLSLLSHLGDLVQSKVKREFEVKDSSALIPGHGGVYDRIDSLLFVSPFFVGFLTFIGK